MDPEQIANRDTVVVGGPLAPPPGQPPPAPPRRGWLLVLVPLLVAVAVGALVVGISLGGRLRTGPSVAPAADTSVAAGAGTPLPDPATAGSLGTAPDDPPAAGGVAVTTVTTTAPPAPVPSSAGIGPLVLGMSTATAQATGWLGARENDPCPFEIDNSRTDDSWKLTGPRVPPGVKGSAFTDGGRLLSVVLEAWPPTGEGVRKGMPIGEVTQVLQRAGFSVTEGDTTFGEHYSASRGDASYYIFVEAGVADRLSLGQPPFCD